MSMNKPDEHRGPEYSVQAEEAWARHSGEKAQGRESTTLGLHCQGQITEGASDNSQNLGSTSKLPQFSVVIGSL